MENQDTIRLLRECDAGSKMAVSSIDEVLENVKDPRMAELLRESKSTHGETGNQIHCLLLENGAEEKEPSAMAKGMSWMKTNVKLGMDESDQTVADLITDGCHMGVKSLARYLNQYKNADATSKGICSNLIAAEEKLATDLRGYL